jgi:glycosyltransferase involved in cell wall biosynthesis
VNFVKNRIALRHTHKKMRNILAISSLLDNYYKQRGCNTVTVPTIIDPEEYASVLDTAHDNREKLTIAYAGVPGKKDYVVNAVKALELLSDDERQRIELHFYGPTAEYFRNSGIDDGAVEKYKENVICHGRIPYSEVKQKIAEADFTVLLRPNKRYANAGFPTKVGESMACGTPVIANITSDLDKYVIDGKTGIVCADETSEACAEAIKRALSLTQMQKNSMRSQCFAMATQAFDYNSYLGVMDQFIGEVVTFDKGK